MVYCKCNLIVELNKDGNGKRKQKNTNKKAPLSGAFNYFFLEVFLAAFFVAFFTTFLAAFFAVFFAAFFAMVFVF